MTRDQRSRIVLAGDIGGTKTNLGLFSRGRRRPVLKAFETYSSREAPNLEALVERFFERRPESIAGACFGIAGPVVNGRCKATNLPWVVSEGRMMRLFGWERVRLINDLAATALAVPLLRGRELFSLNRAQAEKGGNIGVVAPGTGLGQAMLVSRDARCAPVSSEGGHADFSPNNRDEVELWRYLHRRFGHVSIERVLSGPGLVNIYSWLKKSGLYRKTAGPTLKTGHEDPAGVIAEAALNRKSPLCLKALKMFVSIFGAVAGNLALTGMTTGGVYLGGGIAPRILKALKEGIFMRAFVDKGRFQGFMTKIPVRVILSSRAALMGAARHALETDKKQGPAIISGGGEA